MTDRAKVRQTAIEGLTRMLKKSPAWDRSHPRAADVTAAKLSIEEYVKALEEAMDKSFADTSKYQAQFREIVGHLLKSPNPSTGNSCFLFEIHLLAPATVATLPPSRMGSISEVIKAEEAQKALDELGHISIENSKTAGVQCPKCGKVDLSRLNLNRSGLDDERFGKQYETNMDVEDTCQCRLLSEEERVAKEKAEAEAKEKEIAAAKAFAASGNFQTPDGIAPPSAEKAGQKRSRGESENEDPRKDA